MQINGRNSVVFIGRAKLKQIKERMMNVPSKMHIECTKCKRRDSCDNKRMVECAVSKYPEAFESENLVPNSTMPKTQPILIDTSISSEREAQIQKNIQEQINKKLFNCYFNNIR